MRLRDHRQTKGFVGDVLAGARRASSSLVDIPAWVGQGAAIGLLIIYRNTVGLLLSGRCRFYPSCSHFAEQAIRTHGLIQGIGLAAFRLLRCQPLCAGGIDEVPGWRRGKRA